MDTAPERAKSFGAAAQDYDRYRVGPPAAIVAEVTPAHCEAVLDLGAGTGALTRHLVGRFPTVFAVEPDQRMRDVLTGSCPSAVALDGVAEKIPLPDASVDAVLVSSAWHWMDPALAIPEIARVLRPGGQYLFLEHVRSPDNRVLAAFQDVIAVPHTYVAAGCHPNRRFEALLEESPLTVQRVEHGPMPRAFPSVRPTVRGVAVAPTG